MSADYTYDILVNIFGEEGLHKVGETVEHLGMEIAHIKEVSHGVGDAMTKEWQVAMKNIDRVRHHQAEALLAGHENVSSLVSSQNYAGQDKSNDKNQQKKIDDAFSYYKTIKEQLDKQHKLEVDGRAYIRALDEREATSAEAAAIRKTAAETRAIEKRRREELNYSSWWENELNKREKAHDKLINEIRGNAIKAIENERRDRHRANDEALADMEKRHRAHNAIIADIRKETAAMDKLDAASQKSHNAMAHSGSGIQNLINMTHKLRYAWLTVMHIFGGGAIMHGIEAMGKKFEHVIKDTFHLIDDVRKGQTVLTSVGMSDIGKTEFDIKHRGSPAEKAQLARSKEFGKTMIDMAREEAVLTGQSFAEVLTLMKTTVPHMMNKLGLKGNAFLDHGNDVKSFTKKIIEYSSLLKMIDPQNRALRFHEFGLLHMFYGTNHDVGDGTGKKGKKADPTGKANFISLLRREGIKLDEGAMSQITKLTNLGKMTEAMGVFEQAIKKSGLSLAMLADLSGNVLKVNIDACKQAFNNFMLALVTPSYDVVLNFFRSLRQYMTDLQSNEQLMDVFRHWGTSIANSLGLATKDFKSFTKTIANWDLADLQKNGDRVIALFDGIYASIGAFISGLTGTELTEGTNNLDNLIILMASNKDDIHAFGQAVGVISRAILTFTSNIMALISYKDPIIDFWSAITPGGYVVQLYKDIADAYERIKNASNGTVLPPTTPEDSGQGASGNYGGEAKPKPTPTPKQGQGGRMSAAPGITIQTAHIYSTGMQDMAAAIHASGANA